MVYQGRRRALVQAAEAAAATLPLEKTKDNEDAKSEDGKETDTKEAVAATAAALLTPTKPTITARRIFEPLPETAQVTRIREKLARKHADAAPLTLLPVPPSAEKSSTHKVDLLTPPPKGKRKREDDAKAPPPSSQRTIIHTCGRGVDAKRAKVAVDAQMKHVQSPLDHRRSIASSQAMSLGDSSRESTDKSKSRESLGVGLPPWIREIGDSMKSKKRELLSHATTLYASSTHTISALRPTTFNADMAAHSYVMDDAITSLLQMEDETEQEHNMRQGWSSQSAASLPFAYVVKHPLPDDFLRVPGEGAMPSSPLHAPPMAAFDDVDEDIASTPLHPEDLTRQESSYAHDDGTVYGREFIDGDNMMMPPSSPTPMAIPIEYEIRTSDLETGVVVFTRRRFKEFHKFHRKLTALTTRVNGFPFPSRQTGLGKKEDPRVAAQRQPALEAYLRLVASLVTPSPLTGARAGALSLLQTFLSLPDSATLFHNTTLPGIRALRVYAFHVLQDITTPEGKVCRKFLAKPVCTSAALDELGQVLDNVQSYMMEHRMADMKTHVHAFITSSARKTPSGKLEMCDEVEEEEEDEVVAYEWISDAIRHEVEECVCVPVLPALWTALEASMRTKEAAVKARMARLAKQSQASFEISDHTASVSGWRDAIRVLKEVDAMYLPVDKMRKLLECALTVHRTFQREHGHSQVLSGDDFLPIFIYVIVNADISNPLVLLRVLNVLSDPEKRMGESGYYLASYEAALEHLMADD
ncbi:hypothetical protein DYB31_004065 [Aphanomyces astaci]|uniref:VPS9 domain-containing protein n=2 Tax=Aphanomyces astaci TaxID=112090 RepID=A0A397F5H8_APHAT|nr:hypothetical protein DYB31_004065 [Aphanomyces astaci]